MKMSNKYSLGSKQVRDLIDRLILDKYCVHLWLGFGQALFIGFGEEIMPPHYKGQAAPPAEIHTHFADWYIEGPEIRVSSNEPITADLLSRIKQALVGRKVVDWRYLRRSQQFCIEFEGGYVLKIVTWSSDHLIPEEASSDSWCLRLSDGRYLCVSCTGVVNFSI